MHDRPIARRLDTDRHRLNVGPAVTRAYLCRPLRAVVLASALGLVSAGMASAPATAAPRPAPASAIRVAHFSPDTPQMDVYAAGFDGTESLVLPQLGFGQVSEYMSLPGGVYAFSMRPAGAPATSEAALRVSAELTDGVTYTFAAFGRQDSLTTDLLTDDLSPPPAGQARVRIIQGAGDAGPVDVSAGASPLFARGARLGTVGAYTAVPAGSLEITASADDTDDVVQRLDLTAGTVSSVVVLDQPAGGGLQVVRLTDATGTAGGAMTPTGLPAGGVDTGGGRMASERSGGVPTTAMAAAVLLAVVAAVGFGLVATAGGRVRRRPT
jgi:hypothetical protein